MSLLIESKAQFTARAKEVGVSDALVTNLAAAGIDRLSKLAYWVGQPGVALDDDKFDAAIRAANLGAAPSIGDAASLKRLLFEAL